MAKIISVINDKGGVAKTTTVFNLGTALWLLGKKVLLVDNDHQCNLTMIMDKTAQNAEHNLMTWMMDGNSTLPIYTRYDGFDYIPSCTDLQDLGVFLNAKINRDLFLQKRLRWLETKGICYDFILIDCGPGGGTVINDNALAASDEVIIPVGSDTFSVKGRSILEKRIKEVQEADIPLKVAGVLLTKYNPRKSRAKDVKDYFTNYAKTHPDMPMIPLQVHECEAANKANGTQMSVFEYDAKSVAADDYMRLAEWLANGSLARKKSWTPDAWSKKAGEAFVEFLRTQNEEE